MNSMKILAFAGSNHSKSINRIFAYYVASLIKEKEIISLDLNLYEMPIYSEDKERRHGFPRMANEFISTIKKVDAIVLSLAEHNGSYSVAFKNVLDWTSRIDRNVFQNKPMLLLSTSNGQRGGITVLSAALNFFPFLGAKINGHFSLPSFSKNFNQEKNQLENKLLEEEIKKLTIQFEKSININKL